MASQSTRTKRAAAPRTGPRGRQAKGKAKGKPAAARRRRPAAGKSAAQRQRAAARRRPARQPLSDDRLRDLWGLGLLVLAALSGLGLYVEGSAGLAGVFLVGLCRGLFGVFGRLVPPLLVGAALLLLRPPRPTNWRLETGTALGLLAVMGLWHLSAPEPLTFAAGTNVLGEFSGWVGALMAVPLRAVAATAGAAVVLVALLLAAILLITSTSPHAVVEAIVRAFIRQTDPSSPGIAGWLRAHRYRYPSTPLQPGEPRNQEPRNQEPRNQEPTDQEPTDQEQTAAVDADLLTRELPPLDAPPLPSEPDLDPEPSDTQLLPRGVDTHGEFARKLAPPPGKLAPPPGTGAEAGVYEPPPLELFRTGRVAPGNKRTLDAMTRSLEHTLSQFSVNAQVARMSRGPTVTRFEITLGEGVKVAAVTKLEPDIAYALATPEIRIVAPIPGKSAIGIEVPNRDRDLVALGDVLRSPEAAAQHHPLAAGLGVDIANNPVMVNLAGMPHLLIAGATGSGKSVTMNGIVTSVIARATPEQVRMILIDPKRVELNHYDGVPHLLTAVVTDPRRATEALDWVVKEMEHRYERLALLGYRNIDTYNAAVRDGSVRQAPLLSGQADAAWEALPYILCVIDELADLMMVAPRDVETAIVRVAQMARAVGIHLVVATQRPSVDVVTGLIKANIPSRIALAMATQADSRTILDQGGAEKLVGDGDMLFMPANASKPHRIQGCYVAESEIEQVVTWCRGQRDTAYAPGVVREGEEAVRADVTGEDADDATLIRTAMDLVVRSGLGSTSMLQRKLKIGFARAGRLMDELETMGVVGPSEGPKARHVLMTVDDLADRRERDL